MQILTNFGNFSDFFLKFWTFSSKFFDFYAILAIFTHILPVFMQILTIFIQFYANFGYFYSKFTHFHANFDHFYSNFGHFKANFDHFYVNFGQFYANFIFSAWEKLYVVLQNGRLSFYKDVRHRQNNETYHGEQPIELLGCSIVISDYQKRKFVLSLRLPYGSEFLLQANDEVRVGCFSCTPEMGAMS